MKLKLSVTLVTVLWTCFFTGLGYCAAIKPATVAELALYKGADRQQLLEEGAKKEGMLTFYTGGALKQAVQPLVAAFEKKYPFVKVEIYRASSGPMITRVREEYKAGRHIVDAIEGTQNSMHLAREAGLVQPYYSPNLAQIDEDAVTPAPGGGAYAAAFRLSGYGVGYNTKLISKEQAPKTYQDLLDPKWKGKMAIVTADTGVNWVSLIYRTYGEEFLKKLARQEFTVQTVTSTALLELIINGEYAISPTIIDSHVREKQKTGAPVAWVPLEPVWVNLGQIALAKHAPHPHAAMLFVDFELSRESGQLHQRVNFDSFRKDLPPLGVRYKKYIVTPSTAAWKENYEIFHRYFTKK